MADPSRCYLDTSVYLGILLGEPPATKLIPLLTKRLLCASVLLLVEAERNLVRLSREGVLNAEDYDRALQQLKRDQELFLLRDVTADLCLTGAFPPVQIPRSNDLVHLRTAQWFQRQGGLEAFLTLDTRQRAAALDFGLPVRP